MKRALIRNVILNKCTLKYSIEPVDNIDHILTD